MQHRPQKGYILKHRGWWVLRYRDTCLENGILVRRQLARRIEPVRPEHGRLKRPPPEVEAQAREMLQPLNNHTYAPEAMQALGDFVEGVYFPALAAKKRASTIRGYRARWNTQLKAQCGHYRLREFRTCDAQRVLEEIARKNPEFCRSTLHHFRSLLSGVYKFAIQQGYTTGPNPVRECSVPNAPEGEDTHAYSLEEITRIMALVPQPASTITAVAAFLGLRRAEIRGIEWQDYDGNTIQVRRTVWENVTNEPKTKKSKAPVPVIRHLRRILDRYRELRGSPTSGPVFASKAGTPLNLNNVLNRVILPALKGTGVEWHGWHAFRRGLATNLNQLGVDDSVIQSILRHSHVSVTQACYIKTVPQQAVDAMARLDDLCSDCAPESLPVDKSTVN